MAMPIIELISDSDEGGFTARLPDIPAYGEGQTEEAAIADLRAAIKGYIATFGLADAESRIVRPQLREAGWELRQLARA